MNPVHFISERSRGVPGPDTDIVYALARLRSQNVEANWHTQTEQNVQEFPKVFPMVVRSPYLEPVLYLTVLSKLLDPWIDPEVRVAACGYRRLHFPRTCGAINININFNVSLQTGRYGKDAVHGDYGHSLVLLAVI